MSEKLLPCPFCGCQSVFNRIPAVYCADCGAQGKYTDDPEYRAKAWNTRVGVAPAARTPVAWANGDELDNMLDDRTATVSGKPDGFRRTPLFKECEGRASPSPSDFYDHGALYVYDGTSQTFDPYVHPSTAITDWQEALKPLAGLYEQIDDRDADPDTDVFFQHDGTKITFGDIRRARALLSRNDRVTSQPITDPGPSPAASVPFPRPLE